MFLPQKSNVTKQMRQFSKLVAKSKFLAGGLKLVTATGCKCKREHKRYASSFT